MASLSLFMAALYTFVLGIVLSFGLQSTSPYGVFCPFLDNKHTSYAKSLLVGETKFSVILK